MTSDECRDWAGAMGIDLEDRLPGWHHVDRPLPKGRAQLTRFCRHVEQFLQPRTGCLLWVTVWGVWPSSENMHLYYRLRQSYGDMRLLHEAPGHYFLDFEGPDLVSFLELALLSGWDAHLLPVTGYARAFVSHDEFIDFASDPHNPKIAEAFESGLPDCDASGAG